MAPNGSPVPTQPLWTRMAHALDLLLLVLMAASGLQI